MVDRVIGTSDGAEAMLAELDRSATEARERLAADPARRSRLIDYLTSLTEPFPVRSAPAGPVIIEQVQCDGFRRDRIELEILAGMRFRCYVLVPDGRTAPGPTVLGVHGHGYGSRQLTGLLADGEQDPDDHDGHHHFAVALARRGLLVITPDVVGFGERRSEADSGYDAEAGNSCYRLATTLLLHGATLTGLRVAELLGVVAIWPAARTWIRPGWASSAIPAARCFP